MPWGVVKNPHGGYDIVNLDTGQVKGHSDTKEMAQASVRARYANYKGNLKKRSKGKKKVKK